MLFILLFINHLSREINEESEIKGKNLFWKYFFFPLLTRFSTKTGYCNAKVGGRAGVNFWFPLSNLSLLIWRGSLGLLPRCLWCRSRSLLLKIEIRLLFNNVSLLWIFDTKHVVWVAYIKRQLGIATQLVFSLKLCLPKFLGDILFLPSPSVWSSVWLSVCPCPQLACPAFTGQTVGPISFKLHSSHELL